MNDSDIVSRTRRSVVKTLGAGAAIGLAGCSGDSGNEKALFWEYSFPRVQGEDPIWRNEFKSQYEESTSEDIQITNVSYEDMRQKFLTGAKTGNPDALQGLLSHLTEYRKAGHLLDLSDWAKELDFYDGFVDSAIDACTYKGKLYGLPYMGNGRAFVNRTDILEELGQDPPQTTQEFHEIGRLINKEYDDELSAAFHNVTKTGAVRAFQEWLSAVYQYTDNLYVPEGDSWRLNVDAESLGKVFDDWYYQIYAAENPVGNPDDLGTGWQTNDPGYINGNYAFIQCGPWLRSWTSGENIDSSEAAKDIVNNKTLISHIPRGEGGSKATFLEVQPVMVNKHSDQVEQGKEIAAAFTDPDTLQMMAKDKPGNAMTPVHKNVESTIENENWQPFIDIFKSGRAPAKVTWGPVRQEFYPLMQKVAYDRKDPYRAGNELHETLKDLESEL